MFAPVLYYYSFRCESLMLTDCSMSHLKGVDNCLECSTGERTKVQLNRMSQA